MRLVLVELFIALLFNLMSKFIQFRQEIHKAIELASSVTCFVAFLCLARESPVLEWTSIAINHCNVDERN